MGITGQYLSHNSVVQKYLDGTDFKEGKRRKKYERERGEELREI